RTRDLRPARRERDRAPAGAASAPHLRDRRLPHGARARALGVPARGRLTEATYRLTGRALDSRFLALPWGEELEAWTSATLVNLERGVGRHVVRFVEVGGGYYGVKEVADEIAQREYRLLGHLEGTSVPAVRPVAVVGDRRGEDAEALPAVLITRYLDYSLPFRIVLGRGDLEEPEDLLLDALAGLLVRLPVAGLFWGDCSLNNSLFRPDPIAPAAYAAH